MSAIQNIFYTASTISIIILSTCGIKLLHEKAVKAKYEAETAKIRLITGIYDDTQIPSEDIYEVHAVDNDDLNKFHPLDDNHAYVAIDAVDEEDDDHNIKLSPIEKLEFAKHGLTRSLRRKIKIIEVQPQEQE